MPPEDIPSMIWMIEEKIASSEIEVEHRDVLVRLRSMLEEDVQQAGSTICSTIQPQREGRC